MLGTLIDSAEGGEDVVEFKELKSAVMWAFCRARAATSSSDCVRKSRTLLSLYLSVRIASSSSEAVEGCALRNSTPGRRILQRMSIKRIRSEGLETYGEPCKTLTVSPTSRKLRIVLNGLRGTASTRAESAMEVRSSR